MIKKMEQNYWIKDTLVWVILCALTLTSYMQFEAHAKSPETAKLILPIALIKFLLVFLFFMRMKTAHLVWKILAVGYLFVIFVLYGAF